MKAELSKRTFYLLSFTWGLPTTLAGCFAALIMRITGHKPQKWGYCYYFETGKDWGGCSFGPFFIKDTTESLHIKNHEIGHSIQNCYFGFLMPFIVNLPSALRYRGRRIIKKLCKNIRLKPYDSIWFEGQATRLGTQFTEWYNRKPED